MIIRSNVFQKQINEENELKEIAESTRYCYIDLISEYRSLVSMGVNTPLETIKKWVKDGLPLWLLGTALSLKLNELKTTADDHHRATSRNYLNGVEIYD